MNITETRIKGMLRRAATFAAAVAIAASALTLHAKAEVKPSEISQNGAGYPSGLKGDNIPEIARMIAVADAFDAMFSTRPYRKKMPLDEVAAELKRCEGTQFAPEMVEVFLKLIEEGKFNDSAAV